MSELEKRVYICQSFGCTEPAQEWQYPMTDDDIIASTVYYCVDHAHQAGFCKGCGGFWGGVESFEFPESSLLQGYCYDCRESIKHDAPEFWGLDDDEEYNEEYCY